MSHSFRRRLLFLLSFCFSRQKLSQIFLFVKWFFNRRKFSFMTFFMKQYLRTWYWKINFDFVKANVCRKLNGNMLKWFRDKMLFSYHFWMIFITIVIQSTKGLMNCIHQSFSTWVDTFVFCQLFTSLSPNMFSKLCS